MDQPNPALDKATGVLLHPSALPGSPVCGSFGAPTRNWLHCLAENGIGIWQVLPLTPTDKTGSPYSSPSSFALNPWFLDAQDLVSDGFISSQKASELPGSALLNTKKSFLDFELADHRSEELGKSLRQEWAKKNSTSHLAFKTWCEKQDWLEDHVVFTELLKKQNGLPWWKWPKPMANYESFNLDNWKKENQHQLLEHRLIQWHLFRQWQIVRKLSKRLGIQILGDIPFYVARNSADTWSNRSLFSILSDGELSVQSGVPPDYFSEKGQLWGTPVYLWENHKLDKFMWWRKRFKRQWSHFDWLRVDHFRALISYWAIPGTHTSAVDGEWRISPGSELLDLVREDCEGVLPLIAEDLGIITQEVEDLRDKFGLAGMKILQFAFDGSKNNPYLPKNISGRNWVVYSGTHDNPTSIGWWESLDRKTQDLVERTLNSKVKSPGWQLIEQGLSTEAILVIATLQDLLELDDEARFNTPGTVDINWIWRISTVESDIKTALKKFGEKSSLHNRKGTIYPS